MFLMKVTYSIIIVMAKKQSYKWTVIELCVEKRICQSSSLTLIYGLAAANGLSSFYLDILRLNALYEMVVTRATLNLITQRPLKMFFSIIFTDNKTSSIVSYESWRAFLST